MVVPVETGIDISVSSISLINVCLSHALRFVFEHTEVMCEETVSRVDRFFFYVRKISRFLNDFVFVRSAVPAVKI